MQPDGFSLRGLGVGSLGPTLGAGCFRALAPEERVKIMSNKPTRNDNLKNRLSRSREINITVTGRKSGRPISIPVWFVLEGDKLYLLPVQGSDTQWYKNALKNPSLQIGAGGTADFKVIPVTDAKQVSSVVDRFRDKYGASDVRKYYSNFDVAVVVQIR